MTTTSPFMDALINKAHSAPTPKESIGRLPEKMSVQREESPSSPQHATRPPRIIKKKPK